MSRVRSTDEVKRSIRSSLLDLEAMNHSYDSGNFECARTIATIIHRITEAEAPKIYLTEQVTFISFQGLPKKGDSILYSTGLVGMELSVVEVNGLVKDRIEFKPSLDSEAYAPPRFHLNKKQWRRQGIFESYVHDQSTKSWLSREHVISTTRNKSGAHYDQDITNQYEIVHDIAGFLVGYFFEKNGVTYSPATDPDHFEFISTPAYAAIRSISQEILETFAAFR